MLAPFLGSYLWVQIKRSQIRKEVKWKMIAGLDKEELVFMTFSIQDSQEKLNWKHSKEFEYKGEWYDVVQQEVVGDSIRFHLWWDHEETKLSQQLRQLIVMTVSQDSQNQENQKGIVKLFKSLFFKTNTTSNVIAVVENTKRFLSWNESLHNSCLINLEGPPPDVF